MPDNDEKSSKPHGSWKESMKSVLLVVYVFVAAGILNVINTFYFDFEKFADLVGGFLVAILLGGLVLYIFWVGLKAVLAGRDKN